LRDEGALRLCSSRGTNRPTYMRLTSLLLVCALSAPAFIAAACGGDDESVATKSAPPGSGGSGGGSDVASSSSTGGVMDAGPDDETLIALFYPSGLTITEAGGGFAGESCVTFGGYHSDLTLDAAHGGKHVAYAVLPRCPTFGDLVGIDAVTGAASHEFIEAAT